MARPLATGLKYINLDISFFQDRKVRRLIRRNGENAPLVYIALLCTIYSEGYYLNWDNDIALDIADTTRMEEGYVKQVIEGCLEIGLISKEMFDKHRILTSHGIQKQYQAICEQSKRKNVVNEFSLLVSSEETPVNSEETPVYSEETPVNSEETPVYSEEMPQHKRNKHNIKEKNNSSSYSSSFSSSGEKAEAEKQKEKFLSFMFFQNWAEPNKELERFVAYNNTGRRKWSKMNGDERESALQLWKQEPERPKRFTEDFLAMWRRLYGAVQDSEESTHKIRMLALSDKIKMAGPLEGAFTLDCPPQLRDFIEKDPALLNHIREYITAHGASKLFYNDV